MEKNDVVRRRAGDERKEEETTTTPSFETCTRRGTLTRGTLSSANRARGRKDDDDDDAL